MRGATGKKMHDVYMGAWKAGLKTMYYFRSLGASQIEKSTLDAKKFGFTQKRSYTSIAEAKEATSQTESASMQSACSLMNGPDCEACQ